MECMRVQTIDLDLNPHPKQLKGVEYGLILTAMGTLSKQDGSQKGWNRQSCITQDSVINALPTEIVSEQIFKLRLY